MGGAPTKGEVSTPTLGEQQFLPLGMTVLPGFQNQARPATTVPQNNALTAQRRIQAKPFAVSVVHDW